MTSPSASLESQGEPDLFFDLELMRQVLRPILLRGLLTAQDMEVLRFTHEPHFVHVACRLLGKKRGRISRWQSLEVFMNLSDGQGLSEYIQHRKVPPKSIRHQLQICMSNGDKEDVEFLRPFCRRPLHHDLKEAAYCGQPAMIELALSDYSYPGTRRSKRALGRALEMALEFERLQAIDILAPLCVREKLRVPNRHCLRDYFWSRSNSRSLVGSVSSPGANSDDSLIRLLNHPLPGLVPRLLKAAYRAGRWSLWYRICDSERHLAQVDRSLLKYFLEKIARSHPTKFEQLEAFSSLLEALRAPVTLPDLQGPAEAFRQLKNYNVHAPSLELCLYFHNRLKATKKSASKKDASETADSGTPGRAGVRGSASSP